jgi:hypothetical protein
MRIAESQHWSMFYKVDENFQLLFFFDELCIFKMTFIRFKINVFSQPYYNS